LSNWLDDAARRLANGGVSRRDLLKRSGAVAGGALLGSVAVPGGAAARRGAGVPCPDFDSPCLPPDICCGGDACITPSARLGCCHGSTYDPHIEHCCAKAERDQGHACFNDESCCGTDDCCKRDEVCCSGRCLKPSKRLGCCHGSTYDPHIENCCHDATAGQGHACFNDEQCCGATECCKHGQECCSSGTLAYCAPKGHCCPHGQHRVECGHGKGSLCCPEGEYCCNGGCAKPDQCCGTGVCPPGSHCCHGKQCCTGPCCKISCCVGATDQCCHNNNGCCGAKDICCPQGCCIYGCTADGGCASPPSGAPDYPRAPTLR
jgi:hypothetical protein